MAHKQRQQHGANNNRMNKILLPSQQSTTDCDDDCVEISHLIHKLNSLNTSNNNNNNSHSSIHNKYIQQTSNNLSQSETESLQSPSLTSYGNSTINYPSSTNVDISDTSFKTNSSLQLFPKPPLPSISTDPNDSNRSNNSNIYNYDFSSNVVQTPYSINMKNRNNIKNMNNLSNLLSACNGSLNTIYTEHTTPRGIDDVLMVFHELSCDTDTDIDNNNNNNNNNPNCKQQQRARSRSNCHTISDFKSKTKCKAKVKTTKNSKIKPKFEYALTDNHTPYNYDKYTKHKRGNPFTKHLPSK